MSKKPITVSIRNPDGSETQSSSDLESVIVGSGVGAAIRLTDPKVSNLHVMLKVEKNGNITAIDLGSEHGTKYREEVITGPVTLASGDILEVGASRLRVLFGDSPTPGKHAGAEVMKTEQVATELMATEMVEAPKPSKASKKAAPQMEDRALAGTGRNAARVFNETLPPEATPAQDSKVLQVALVWGDTIIDVKHIAEKGQVTIGSGAGNTFTVFSETLGDSFVLAQAQEQSTLINVPNGAGLVLSQRGDTHKTREQLKGEGKLRAGTNGQGEAVELALHDRAQVSLAEVAFIIRYVRPSAAVAVSRLDDADYTFFKIASACVMAFFAMVAAILLAPPLDGTNADDIFQNPSKYVKMLVKAEKKQEIKKLNLSGVKEGEKAKDKEGKFGKQDEKKKEADPSKKGAPVVDANKREEDRKKVMAAGLLAALGNGAASNVLGPGGLGTGINNAIGGLQGGAGLGDAQGVGGLGSRGTGAGGGGNGLGLGGLGTKGGGRGAGGYGSIDLGGRGKDVTRIVPGKTTVVGGLSKDQIDKVIKRHQSEIKYCFEQEMNKDPNMAGKVAVFFTIDPTGAVSDANVSETTLNSSNAENCMLSRIRRWKFPEPQGGGVVQVTYPWVFKAAGGAGEE